MNTIQNKRGSINMKYYWIQKDDNNHFNYLYDYADVSESQDNSSLQLLFKTANTLLEAKNNAFPLDKDSILELEHYLQTVGFVDFNLPAYLRN